MNQIYLGGLAFETGEFHNIETLDEDPLVIKKLLNGGLLSYCKAECDITELVKRSVTKTLESVPAEVRSSVGAVIFASSGYFSNDNRIKEINSLTENFGLQECAVFGVTLNACAGFTSSLLIAEQMIKGGIWKSILLICLDEASPDSRIASGGISVLSDAAASCIVSSFPLNYRLLGSSVRNDAVLWRKDPVSDSFAFLVRISKITECLVKNLQPFLGQRVVQKLLTNNYNVFTQEAFCYNFSKEIQLLYPGLNKFAHCYASDLIINLSLADKLIDSDEAVYLFSTGLGAYGLSAVVKEQN
jgi:3-oxoacyl-[acyl-carrier-protein] synthase III